MDKQYITKEDFFNMMKKDDNFRAAFIEWLLQNEYTDCDEGDELYFASKHFNVHVKE